MCPASELDLSRRAAADERYPATTVLEALARVGKHEVRGHVFVRADGSERKVPFCTFVREVREVGAGLIASGLRRGDRVALVIPDPEAFVTTFLGAMTVGLVPVPLYPPPSMTKLDGYAETLAHVLSAASAAALIAPKAQHEMLADHVTRAAPEALRIEAEHIPRAMPVDPADGSPWWQAVAPDEMALLQFTSGSTSAPKGVVVTHGQLAANGRAIMIDGLRSSGDDDVGVSWLPLYHDMGLIGFVVAPLFTEVPIVFIPTSTFVRRPTSWLAAIHKHRGTITFAPNFAYALATRSIQARHMEGWDLSCLRVSGCGAEPISADVLRGFAERFAPVGFRAEALMPAYGMAEATLAVTFADLTAPFRTDVVDAESLKAGKADARDPRDAKSGVNASVELVGCGRALRRFSVQVRDESGRVLPDRMVGEIFVSGPSIANGYFRNAEATGNAFVEGWLRTGDLGYLVDGELFVSGRKKDVIIINGRNYAPQDIEAIVSSVNGVRFGQVACFGLPARNGNGLVGETLAIVAETVRPPAEQAALKAAIGARVQEMTGLVAGEIALIARGTLPKTSSGKVRRAETRARLQLGSLELADQIVDAGIDSLAPENAGISLPPPSQDVAASTQDA
jgi:fatty-acyl-CoA synthase